VTHYIAADNRAIPDIFAAIDSLPNCLQGYRKSLVYVWKCFHHWRSNLRDRSLYDTDRARNHVWLTISRPLIVLVRIFLQRSIVHRNVYKVSENRLSMSENDAIAEGQTCGIARFLHLSEKTYLHTVLS